MATLSGTSLDGVSAVAAERHGRVRLAALVGGAVLCLLYLLLPTRFVFLREELFYVGGEVAAIAAILVGVRWYRPAQPLAWFLMAGGLACWAVGDTIWGAYVLRDQSPFPSAADVFYIPGYVLIAAGLAVAARRRFAERNFGALLDAFILSAVVGLLVWTYVVAPLRNQSDLSTLGTAISILYPFLDLLLLVVAARFMVGDDWRLPAFSWLAAALLLTFLGDMSSTLSDIGDTWISEQGTNTLLLAGILSFGLAALDPSMRSLTERAYVKVRLPGPARLALVALATLVPVSIRAVQAARGKHIDLPVNFAATGLIFTAALLRWSGVLAELRRTIRRESTLRGFGQELLETSGRPQLAALAERTTGKLVRQGSAELVMNGGSLPEESPHELVAEIVVRGERVGALVVRSSSNEILSLREVMDTVANELALALEREQLLEAERATAETLAEQNEQLRELDKLKTQFVSTVSHELRTPLTSMIGYLEVTLDGEAGELNEEQRQFLEIVNRNCARLNKLIDDILFTSRVDSGRLSLDPSWVSLGELAQACVVSARMAAEKRGIHLHCATDEDLPPFWGDPTRLTQMIDNLLTNAIKFTPEGGNVEVSVHLRDGVLHAEVADSGVGIPEDEVGRLFERFFRASTGVTAPGTGLGLSIVQSIVQVHGGTVGVRSELGVGTTFEVDLPLPGIAGAPTSNTAEVAT